MKTTFKTLGNWTRTNRYRIVTLAGLLSLMPLYTQAQGTSPWENAVTVLQTAFTGTIAKGLALVAIVIGGLTFAFGLSRRISPTHSTSSFKSTVDREVAMFQKFCKYGATIRRQIVSISIRFIVRVNRAGLTRLLPQPRCTLRRLRDIITSLISDR
jgi:hypothetical protein